jgi:hypothetical protein
MCLVFGICLTVILAERIAKRLACKKCIIILKMFAKNESLLKTKNELIGKKLFHMHLSEEHFGTLKSSQTALQKGLLK